jgi:hypothetical protein
MNKSQFFSYLALITLLISCEDEPVNNSNVLNFYETIPMFKTEPEIFWSYYKGRVYISSDYTYDSTGNRVNNSKVIGLFYSEKLNYVTAGIMLLNNEQIPSMSIEQIYGYKLLFGDIFSIGSGYYQPLNKEKLDSLYYLKTFGSSRFPGMEIVTASPKGDFSLISPVNNSTIKKSEDLKISLNKSLADTNFFRVILTTGNVRKIFYGSAIDSIIITKEFLEQLNTGQLKFEICYGQMGTIKLDESDYGLCAVYYSETMHLNLIPN